MGYLGEGVAGRANSQCKGPEVATACVFEKQRGGPCAWS